MVVKICSCGRVLLFGFFVFLSKSVFLLLYWGSCLISPLSFQPSPFWFIVFSSTIWGSCFVPTVSPNFLHLNDHKIPEGVRDWILPEIQVLEVLHQAEDVDDVIEIGEEVVTHVQALKLRDQLQWMQIKHLVLRKVIR